LFTTEIVNSYESLVNLAMPAQLFPTWWVYQHVPIMLFVFAFGACVGSFLNVVIYRLPRGMSLSTPPSRCPTCGAKLRFFTENLPILGWFLLRGRCRYCGVKISSQYMIVELLMAIVFIAAYAILYLIHPDTPWLGQIGSAWWEPYHGMGFFRTWPIYIAVMFMVSGLVAMTVIDARTFTIPIQIPVFVTLAGFIAFALQGLLPLHPREPVLWPIPATDWTWFMVSSGGMLGLVISMVLLRLGKLRYSFADYDEYVEEGEILGDYPHARREMWVELAFLLPCFIGLGLGWLVASLLPDTSPPVFIQAIGGSMLGYLVGGALVWGVRILGTFGFGREAMGMGDVHLLAAVGAVLGAADPVWIFFLAPFSGLLWHIVASGLSSVLKSPRRELPYGPHLAIATVALLVARPFFDDIQGTFLPWLPSPGLF